MLDTKAVTEAALAAPTRVAVITARDHFDRVAPQRIVYDLLPPGVVEPGYDFDSRRGYRHQMVRLKNGSSIHFFNLPSRMAFAGLTFDRVIYDGPVPPEVVAEAEVRLTSSLDRRLKASVEGESNHV